MKDQSEEKQEFLPRKRDFSPSDYEINENVLVKNINTSKKIRSNSVYAGVVKQRKGDRYKGKYNKNGKTELRWFPVSQVISKTKNIENEKQAVKNIQDTQSFKSNFHLWPKMKVENAEKEQVFSNTATTNDNASKSYNLRKT